MFQVMYEYSAKAP